jgi:hypothetical protein
MTGRPLKARERESSTSGSGFQGGNGKAQGQSWSKARSLVACEGSGARRRIDYLFENARTDSTCCPRDMVNSALSYREPSLSPWHGIYPSVSELSTTAFDNPVYRSRGRFELTGLVRGQSGPYVLPRIERALVAMGGKRFPPWDTRSGADHVDKIKKAPPPSAPVQ